MIELLVDLRSFDYKHPSACKTKVMIEQKQLLLPKQEIANAVICNTEVENKWFLFYNNFLMSN